MDTWQTPPPGSYLPRKNALTYAGARASAHASAKATCEKREITAAHRGAKSALL